MADYNCYIDEAGDEGFFKLGATSWFLMAGVLVEKSLDATIGNSLERVRARIGKGDDFYLHWRKMQHEWKRVYVDEIAKQPIIISIAAASKSSFDHTTTLQKPPWLYNYTTRYLIERVSWFVGDQGGRCNLIFSNRAHTRYADLEGYIRSLAASSGTTVRNVFGNVSSANATLKNLQIADAVAGAAFNALEENAYGLYEDCYIRKLSHQLYRKNGNLLSYGFKIVGTGKDAKAVVASRPWLGKL